MEEPITSELADKIRFRTILAIQGIKYLYENHIQGIITIIFAQKDINIEKSQEAEDIIRQTIREYFELD